METILDLRTDTTTPFLLTRNLYIKSPSPFTSRTEVFDLTTKLSDIASSSVSAPVFASESTSGQPIDLSKLVQAAKTLVTSTATNTASIKPLITITSTHWYSKTQTTATDATTSTTIATSSSPLLSFGSTHITFPTDSEYSSHEIHVTPLRVRRRAMGFVVNSVPYVWEGKNGEWGLFKNGSGNRRDGDGSGDGDGEKMRIEIARFVPGGKKGEVDGLVGFGEGEIGAVVGVLTLLAVLNRNESFISPWADFSKGK